MKLFFTHRQRGHGRGGFSLAEATFSIGLLSSSFLILAPLLGLGLKAARLAHTDQATAQIARTLTEEARQGSLSTGTIYLDNTGSACTSPSAAYCVLATTDSPAAALTRVTLRVTPVGAPDHARIYAVVYPTSN